MPRRERGEAEEATSRPTTTLSSALAAQITAMQPLRYAAYAYDTWSNTYYLQARHYDPATRQFLTKDPAEADGEESAYQYCAGDPVNQDDPDGEFAQVLWGAVGGAAWYAGERAVAGAWKARSVFKKRGFKAGMRATWRNVRSSWSWKSFGREVAIGAATGGLGKLAKAGKVAKAARGARCRVLSKGSRFANKASRGRIPAKTYCFVAGTLVLTASGTLPIEAVAVGDSVLSRDPVTGEQSYRPVTETFTNTTTELIHVRTAEDTITATPAHPFWVEGTGWVDAGELESGAALSLADGKHATILSVTREKLSSPRDVYNFEVEGFHTYFVASAGVWVHNMCAAAKKPVVIGENMKRVQRYADKLDAHIYQPTGSNPLTALKRQERWALEMRRQGRTVIDIGPDFARRRRGDPPSPFYGVERKVMKGYAGYKRVWRRAGRLRGGIR